MAAPEATPAVRSHIRRCLFSVPADADLIFTAVKPKGAKRISFETFEAALEKVGGGGWVQGGRGVLTAAGCRCGGCSEGLQQQPPPCSLPTSLCRPTQHRCVQVAAKKKASVAEVAASIVATGGPKSSGTIAEACRLFDDKSSW